MASRKIFSALDSLSQYSGLGYFGTLFMDDEALEVDVTIDNVLAYHGLSRNDFKVKVEFRYGYSGPVHKEKIVWVRKNLEPGESNSTGPRQRAGGAGSLRSSTTPLVAVNRGVLPRERADEARTTE